MNIDERYKRGMIYTIRNYTDDTLIYVGSTINTLSKRFNKHKEECKKGHTISLYNYIENNDWTDWYIELYEAYSCNNKQELDRREGQVIREIGTINKRIAGRSPKEYREDNVDKIKEQKKEWRENNKEKISQYKTQNADKVKEYQKQYYEQNADKIKKYREENADKLKESKKKYRENNKEKISQRKTEKICCDICCAIISRHSKSKHQKSKTCLVIKNLSNTDIPIDSHIADL